MKVWFITHYGAAAYGSNLSLLGLIDGLAGTEVEPRVLMPEGGSLCELLQARGVPFLVRPFAWWVSPDPRPLGPLVRLLRNLRSIWGITDCIPVDDCDLVYSNSSVIPFGMLVARCLRKPHIWHLREFVGLDTGLRFDWGCAVHRRIVARSSATICVSRAVQGYWLGSRGLQRSKVIYNGVLPEGKFKEWLEARSNGRRGPQAFTFAMLGCISPAKGQDLAIRALGHLVRDGLKVRLIIAGDGRREDVDGCHRVAAECGVADAVEFRGYVKTPRDVYLSADAVLVCSRREGMGRVTAEAMAASLPVIGTGTGGTPELVQDGVNGLLFDGTVAQLAERMRLLADNPDSARAMGLRAWKWAVSRYTTERYSSEVRTVLQSVVYPSERG